jgi:hypothetical protein
VFAGRPISLNVLALRAQLGETVPG